MSQTSLFSGSSSNPFSIVTAGDWEYLAGPIYAGDWEYLAGPIYGVRTIRNARVRPLWDLDKRVHKRTLQYVWLEIRTVIGDFALARTFMLELYSAKEQKRVDAVIMEWVAQRICGEQKPT